jgi:hypothetical protein
MLLIKGINSGKFVSLRFSLSIYHVLLQVKAAAHSGKNILNCLDFIAHLLCHSKSGPHCCGWLE